MTTDYARRMKRRRAEMKRLRKELLVTRTIVRFEKQYGRAVTQKEVGQLRREVNANPD